MPPPSGQVSNFIDPPTLLPAAIVASTVILTITTVFVAARFTAKTFVLRKHYLEDYLCYAAWAGVVTYTGLFLWNEDYGWGRHMWDVTPSMLKQVMYHLHIMYCIYSPVTLAAKLSVLFQIKRMFTTWEKNMVYWVVMGSIIANSVFYTGLFFSYVFQCWPRAAIWDPSVKGKCVSAIASNLVSGVLNVVSDVEALALPAWAIWHLNMPVKRKVLVFAVFGVGSIACIIGVVGIYFRVILLKKPDFTWICSKAAMLVISEMAVVVIVGCCPCIPALLRYCRGVGRPSPKSTEPSSDPASTPRRYSNSKALNSLAKYMSPGPIGMSKLDSSYSDENLELRQYSASIQKDRNLSEEAMGRGKVGIERFHSTRSEIVRTTRIEQSVEKKGIRLVEG
ncbi:hypothetical protein BU16DRAFT_518609 [Lophium mytilinum]|uniref:Rhodopsin domain-containing protein n=1 Tax=Lophium mytilinum TaxID=390894 RepID=A0A6A6QCW6_9PEZI|nr:hypothetical protein BU16DRAFT_518609 [Lophium mytilinum]